MFLLYIPTICAAISFYRSKIMEEYLWVILTADAEASFKVSSNFAFGF